jgi:YD repeat-containing protein
VNQSGQTRSWTYDFQGRLRSETHPESGTTTYVPDNAGNILSRTDARQITTTYTYDAIDRLRTTSYSDGPPPNGTPPVTRTYDEGLDVDGRDGRIYDHLQL